MVENFEARLREYARLLVEVGLNVQPRQTPFIDSSVEYTALTRLCVSACYDCGARDVVVQYGDDYVLREQFLRADAAVFEEYPSYMKARLDWLLERKSPRLSLSGSDPELLKGADPNRIQARRKVAGLSTKPYFDAMTANKFQWCVGSWPTRAWAEKAAGLNRSITHVDFMAGTADLSIVGTTQDGREIPVFTDGNFAF